MTPRLARYYTEVVCQDLLLKLPITTPEALPRLTQLDYHVTSGRYRSQLHHLLGLLQLVGLRHPQLLRARRAYAPFRLRGPTPLGGRVVLRGEALYEALDTLSTLVLPTLREFQGFHLPGNQCVGHVGLPHLQSFPQTRALHSVLAGLGLDITVHCTSHQARGLLFTALHLPLHPRP
jgi:ribosomal protein L5